jgi:hypothetical protein
MVMVTMFVDGKLVEANSTVANELIALRIRMEAIDKLYRYYIVDIDKGCIFGTNDNQDALDFSTSDKHFVIDTKFGKQLKMMKDVDIKYLGD